MFMELKNATDDGVFKPCDHLCKEKHIMNARKPCLLLYSCMSILIPHVAKGLLHTLHTMNEHATTLDRLYDVPRKKGPR
jgi:hypothetical protein